MVKGFFDRIIGRRRGEEFSLELMENCLHCGADLSSSELFQRYRVCPQCGYHYVLPAWERIELLADEGSFKEVNRSLVSLDPLSFSGEGSYKKRIFDAQKRTGLNEAVVTGLCQIEGNPTVLVVLDFGFLGGSIGCVVGEKVALAFELAMKRKFPLVAVISSGGARIQEGVFSLMQMAKTAAVTKRLHAAGLPFISVLTNPTTGEAYASFASLADVIIAEPNALIGLAPLKVVEQTEGRPLPESAHNAESQLQHGMIDRVVERPRLRELISILLDLLCTEFRLNWRGRGEVYAPVVTRPETAWHSVQLARHEQRPTSLDYISRMTSSFVELHGDRCYGDDGAVVCGIGDVGGEAVMIIAQERGHGEERNRGRAYPEGFRKAQRAMNLAAKFRLPVITLIDPPGAYSGLESEERGVGSAIAHCLALMSDLPVPIIAAIIGEGGSEGALAFGIADSILMLENAIFSVVPPERAAALLYRDVSRAAEVAPALRLTAHDLMELGVVDILVPEPKGGAHADPDEAARQLKKLLLSELVRIQKFHHRTLVKERYERFRHVGRYGTRLGVVISREMAQLQEYLARRVEELKEYLPSRAVEISLPEKKESPSEQPQSKE